MAAQRTRGTLGNPMPRVTEGVLTEFSEFADGIDGALAWKATIAAFGDYLHQGPGHDPWAEIATRIEAAVDDGRPASFIRLGDGEGNLLALALDERPALTDYCVRSTSVRHLGVPDALPSAAPEVLPAYRAMLRNADLIGFPGPFGPNVMLRRSKPETYLRPIQGLVCVHRYLTGYAGDLALRSKTGAPAGFHRGLLPHYGRLISGRRIGIVTCHEQLQSALRTRLGATDVDLRLVPRQAKYAHDPTVTTGHWPERFHELTRELQTIEPGTLWFVAAGMVGKPYCDVIKRAGGVAVDIGHTADIWAGVRTRSYDQTELLAAWQIV
jgi:hypothetical protein